MNNFEFKDKVALVTGANRGIGEAYVLELLGAGVKKIYAAARDLDNLKSLVEKKPEVIEAVLLDVTNPQHVSELIKKISALDILINNAGIANGSSFTADDSLEIARQEMETNFFAQMRVTQAVLPLLKQSKQAAIINVSSIAGLCNFPGIATYSASKAAMHSYTQGLRHELSAEGFNVVGVYPGPIDTRMAEAWEMDKPKPQQVAQKTFEALNNGEKDVLPDDFSQQMYAMYLEHPHQLEKAFFEMQ